jgi:hypothetical protein
MSALGHLNIANSDVCFAPENGHQAVRPRCPLSANCRHQHGRATRTSGWRRNALWKYRDLGGVLKLGYEFVIPAQEVLS